MPVTTSRLLARWTLAPGVVLALVIAMLAVASPAEARKVRSDFFGMHDPRMAFEPRDAKVPAVAIGIGSVRLWDTGTSWADMTDSLGNVDLTRAINAVERARSQGLRPMLVLGQTPAFDEEPLGKSGRNSMPRLASWTAYVDKVGRQFGNTVDYQIWNEPSVTQFWDESVADMATLTTSASRTLRSVVPQVSAGARPTVVAPALPLRLERQEKWYKRYWSETGVANAVDVVAVNLYPGEKAGPEGQLPLLKYARANLPKAARSKPMWNTELNYGLPTGGSGGSAAPISSAKEASYVSRSLVLNAASPIRRVYWYAWGRGDIGNTQLVTSDGSLTAAGRAWRKTRGWINGTDLKSCVKAKRGKTKGVYTCTAKKSRLKTHRIYWKPSGRAVKVPVHKTATKKQTLGGSRFTRVRRGSRIKVGSTPIMVISRR